MRLSSYNLFLTLCLLLCIGNQVAQSQVRAGVIPPGAYAVNPGINLTVVNVFQDTTVAVDMNCDVIPDFEFQLIKGDVAVDGTNYIFLRVNNPSFEICSDTLSGTIRIVDYFNATDILNCIGGYSWANDSIYILGEFGGFGVFGPSAVSSLYFAYRNGGHIGWMRVTFDLVDGGGINTITFLLTEYINYCNPNEIDELKNETNLEIFPNPTSDCLVKLKFSEDINQVELYNLLGEKVKYILNKKSEILLPEAKGFYFVKVSDRKGRFSIKKIVSN